MTTAGRSLVLTPSNERAELITADVEENLTGQGTPPLVLCHVSHVYETGCSLYFTIAARGGDDALDRWLAAKAAASSFTRVVFVGRPRPTATPRSTTRSGRPTAMRSRSATAASSLRATILATAAAVPAPVATVATRLLATMTITATTLSQMFAAIARAMESKKEWLCELDGVIAIGGEGTLGAGARLGELAIPIVGVPKTIDNDLSGTDFTFGFDTAVNIAMDAIDRLHTTAESHHRVLVVEVMGRHAGWIALHAGLAGGASSVLIPEVPFDIGAVCAHVEARFRSEYAPIIVVAEGAVPADGSGMTLSTGEKDAFGHVRLGGIGDRLALEIEQRTGKEARAVVLGHVQRGGTPSAFDRWLATRFGLHAIDAVADGDWGVMVALQGTDIVRVPLSEATGTLKVVSPEEYAEAQVFFG